MKWIHLSTTSDIYYRYSHRTPSACCLKPMETSWMLRGRWPCTSGDTGHKKDCPPWHSTCRSSHTPDAPGMQRTEDLNSLLDLMAVKNWCNRALLPACPQAPTTLRGAAGWKGHVRQELALSDLRQWRPSMAGICPLCDPLNGAKWMVDPT